MAETDTKVKPNEPAKTAGNKPADGKGAEGQVKKDEKQGSTFWKKNKVWILGGVFLVLVVIYFLSRGSGNSAAQNTQAQQAAQAGIDPSTGYLYGSPADIAALGGSGSVAATPGQTGAAGSAGTAGPAGPAGPPGVGLARTPGGSLIASGPIYQKISFSQAQALAGKKGSSQLFYGSGGKIVQGKYANDKNVQYYTKV